MTYIAPVDANYILLIDDLRDFYVTPPYLFVARTSAEGVNSLASHYWVISEIWLDHDLGEVDGKPDDIWPVVDLLSENANILNQRIKVYIHTSNPAGRHMMNLTLLHFGYSVKLVQASDYLEVK